MKVSPHFLRLYDKTSRRYRKLIIRLKRQVANGSFHHRSEYAQGEFLFELKKLKKRLIDLKVQLKLAAAVGTITFFASTSISTAQTSLGPFDRQPRYLNPLREPFEFTSEPSPAIVDLDGDGDNDIVVGEFYDRSLKPDELGLRYFENKGTGKTPLLEEIKGDANPFSSIQAHLRPSPAPSFGDVDNDGDFDLVIGTKYGSLLYFENIGDIKNPKFELREDGNPFKDLSSNNGYRSTPHLADLDQNGDLDLIIGGREYIEGEGVNYLRFFKNDGIGRFINTPVIDFSDSYGGASPTTLDLDEDGDLDIVLGKYLNNRLVYYENVGKEEFRRRDGEANPFSQFTFDSNNEHPAPAAIDFDNDGDFDLIVGSGIDNKNTNKISYFENQGNGTFNEKSGLDNPFDGVNVEHSSTPYITQIDHDRQTDVILGSGLNPLKIYKGNNGAYRELTEGEPNPFSELSLGQKFSPTHIDIDNDGDLDLIGGAYQYESGEIQFFKNENGTYIDQHANSPFAKISLNHEPKIDFVDIDDDGDFDLFASDYSRGYIVRFYENTGSSTIPIFINRTGPYDPSTVSTGPSANRFAGNPLAEVSEEHLLYPRFIDIDHDGDYDALIGEGGDLHSEITNSNEFLYYENIGSKKVPKFVYKGDIIPQFTNAEEPSPAFIDQDNDGDLDVFQGDNAGVVRYYKNNNPAPILNVQSTTIQAEGTAGSFFIDATLTITDTDSDNISYALVRVENFSSGDGILQYTMPVGELAPAIFENEALTALYDGTADGGILVFRGKASIAFYQQLLRSVKFTYTEQESARRKTSGNGRTKPGTVSLKVLDADYTNTTVFTRNYGIISNSNPAIAATLIEIFERGSKTIDLDSLISDPDTEAGYGLDLSTLKITTPLASGALASIEADNKLVVDYANKAFSGTETLIVEVCDLRSACVSQNITLNVIPNTEPGDVEVFNAVAPHGQSANNRYLHVENIPDKSKVTIFNRWGDKVYEKSNYNNDRPGDRFEGHNDNGKELPSGTYFYKIEFTTGNKKPLTGYLSLKQ
jgi:gliding motility-associated-like protein